MEENSIKARGNIARQANKKVRRHRILELAVQLIASDGIGAFTLSGLAEEAGVSTPTIHNLFGKKNDIIKELVSDLIHRVPGIHEENPPTDPIPNTKYFVGNVATAFERNEDFYRAAFMSAEQLGLFDPRIPGGLYQ